MSKAEFNSRLQHLANVFEIVCISSSLDDYNLDSWQEGNAYNTPVLDDLETDMKSWSSMSKSIDSTCWQFARAHSKPYISAQLSPDSEECIPVTNRKWCTSYNNFRKDGCQYEFLHPGRMCNYIHSCSYCLDIGLGHMPHKVWQCNEFYQSGQADSLDPSSTDLSDDEL